MTPTTPARSVTTSGLKVASSLSPVAHCAESRRQRRGTRGRKQQPLSEHQRITTSLPGPLPDSVAASASDEMPKAQLRDMIEFSNTAACHEGQYLPSLNVEEASHATSRNIFITNLKSIVGFNFDTRHPEEKAARQLKIIVLLELMQGYVVEFALEKEGCRVVQYTLEVANRQGQALIMQEFHGRVCEALRSPHANHVLQRAIELMSPTDVNFLFLELLQQFEPFALAKHQFGCRVLERLIEHFPPPVLAPFIHKLLDDVAGLSRHVYGNFVIQHILEHCEQVHKQRIIDALCDDLAILATHEHATGVVDKALTFCIPKNQRKLAQQILGTNGLLVMMASQQSGFAATQRLFKVVDGELLAEAKSQLLAGIQQLQGGKRGAALLTSLMPEYQYLPSPSRG